MNNETAIMLSVLEENFQYDDPPRNTMPLIIHDASMRKIFAALPASPALARSRATAMLFSGKRVDVLEFEDTLTDLVMGALEYVDWAAVRTQLLESYAAVGIQFEEAAT